MFVVVTALAVVSGVASLIRSAAAVFDPIATPAGAIWDARSLDSAVAAALAPVAAIVGDVSAPAPSGATADVVAPAPSATTAIDPADPPRRRDDRDTRPPGTAAAAAPAPSAAPAVDLAAPPADATRETFTAHCHCFQLPCYGSRRRSS